VEVELQLVGLLEPTVGMGLQILAAAVVDRGLQLVVVVVPVSSLFATSVHKKVRAAQ
jgi:hypothetical protein